MTNREKKQLKQLQIKLGYNTPAKRSHVWDYVLHGDQGVGYADAQDLYRYGFDVLKQREYDPERPD